MKFGVPWTVKGVKPKARVTAREAARRSGMSVRDWLNFAILEQAEDDFYEYDHHENNSPDREFTFLRQRLDQLAGRLEDILLKESADTPAHSRDDTHRISELIDRLEQRFEEFSNITRPVSRKAAPSIVPSPVFDRAADATTTPTQSSPCHDLSGLEDQLRRMTDQIETLRSPAVEAINVLRGELEEMGRALNELLPRQAIDAIESKIQKLYECISRQTKSDNAILVRIETSLADLRSALRDLTPASLKQVEDDIAALREMMTHGAPDESVKSLAVQVGDLSDKIDKIQHMYAARATAVSVHGPLQLRTETIAAPETCDDDTLSPPAEGSGRFIAAARRAARVSSHEADADTPLMSMNARIDDKIETSSYSRKLMTGIKFLFVAAGIVIIVIGSIELAGHIAIRNFSARLFGSVTVPLASDMTVKQHISQIDPEVEQPPPENLSTTQNTPQGTLEEMQGDSHEATNTLVPTFLPASGNLFNTTASSNTMELIHGTPSLFGPPISIAASKHQSDAVGSMASVSADTHQSANSIMPADALPSTIGGERLRKAAMVGDPQAAYIIAQRYAEGHGVSVSLEEAARWYKRAASKGLVPAQFRYAIMLEKGQGVRKNLEQARQFYLAAASNGNTKSMHNLAVLYAQGIDGKPDYTNAVVWFRKAANYGIADSQYNLAALTERGLGTETNLIEAYKWYALAAAQGDQEAGNKRDEIAAQLDPQQLTAAQDSVKAFTAKLQPQQAFVVSAGDWDSTTELPRSRNQRPANPPMVLSAFKIGAR